ncbi:hypothetical protein JCM19236_4906 [Vibrio sp. JCM 19236]|nr:hypothetical protein JCM19236_4906 [Vibrio sp. JCM 19236]
MLVRFEDESLHSYLLRRLFCVGEFTTKSIKGIVSVRGFAPAYPRILIEHIDYFRYDSPNSQCNYRNTILPFLSDNLVEDGSYVRINRALFHDFGEDSYFYGSTQMRFCGKCLSNRIKNDGFAWLSDEWLFTESCPRHNELMQEVRSYNCDCKTLSILQRLRSVFLGRCIGCNSDIHSKAPIKKETYRDYQYPSNYRFHDIVDKFGDDWFDLDGKKIKVRLSDGVVYKLY